MPLPDNPGDCQLLQDLMKGPAHGLRQLAYLPEALPGRPEMGFGCGGSSKIGPKVFSLNPATLEREGLLSPKPLARTWPGTARKMRGISPGTWCWRLGGALTRAYRFVGLIGRAWACH